jgi:hypothetical protein
MENKQTRLLIKGRRNPRKGITVNGLEVFRKTVSIF